jgi:RES domain-containing protein
MDYTAFKMALPTDSLETLDPELLNVDWRADIGHTRSLGDEWLRQNRSLALAVPSAVLIESTNILINPAHPRAHELVIDETAPFEFDPRLRPG